ncbi:DUF4190 domain-containing protein [Catellatospora tritici]|uniref:DUF4190 domain-containing protein n=1 Tax=Catellatospora tritici TaxID=2851566 RepID=UPI001C2D1674|nr:DUF4190 domain-containing protein [Catellatospora tritici]MBV1849869.1 DUF4190 domain-containing protein [Catellatospora tritici]
MSDPTAPPPPNPQPGAAPAFPEPAPLTFGEAAASFTTAPVESSSPAEPVPADTPAQAAPTNPYGAWAGVTPGAAQPDPATVPGQYPAAQYPQGYAYPGYPAHPGYQAYPYGYAYVPARRTNGLAIGAMVTSIVGAITFCFLYGIPGLVLGPVGAILGHVARRRIRASGEEGDGMALAGVIIGWIVTGLSLLLLIGIVIFFVWLAQQPTYNSDPGTFATI